MKQSRPDDTKYNLFHWVARCKNSFEKELVTDCHPGTNSGYDSGLAGTNCV